MGRQTIVAGTGHQNKDGSKRNELIAKYVTDKIPVLLAREPDNPFDKNAIAVFIEVPRLGGIFGSSKKQIGYIASRAAASISKRIDRNEDVSGFVSSFDLYNEAWPRVSLTLNY